MDAHWIFMLAIWLAVEVFSRKTPRPKRIRRAATVAFIVGTLSLAGQASSNQNIWVFLVSSAFINGVGILIFYGIRLLISKVWDKFSKGKNEAQDTILSAVPNNGLSKEASDDLVQMPGANPSNKFYFRDANTEGLRTPIHIHFDSYKPVLKMGNRTLDNPCIFLVTITSPTLSHKGRTCYVSGINHKLTPTGVVDGVVAEVKMVRNSEEDDSLERVIVRLHEDGSVDGLVTREGQVVRITDLDGVYFMPSDSTYLDGMGNPLPPEQQPGNTKAQKALIEREQQEMTSSIMER